jgi:deoxyribose-phosphate aldolase
MKPEQIKELIDQTMLKPANSFQTYAEFVEDAANVGFKGICIPSSILIDEKIQSLKGNSLLVTVVGFPLGYSTLASKVFETKEVVKHGADEVDYVLNLTKLKNGDWNYIEEEMQTIQKAAQLDGQQIPVKVIIETAYLEQDEKQKVCELVKKVGLAFIKTSTGFASSGAQLEDIKLFKSILEGECQIKASGGIKTKEDLILFHEAGADRIGTSSGSSLL